MPIVIVEQTAGRSPEQKRQVAKGITDAFVQAANPNTNKGSDRKLKAEGLPLVRSYARPRGDESSTVDAEPALPSRKTLTEPGRILVVDDHEEVAQLIKHDLESEGHEVVMAQTLDAALAATGEDRPLDLAIVDVMLGAASGYDLTADLVSRTSEYTAKVGFSMIRYGSASSSNRLSPTIGDSGFDHANWS